MGLDIGPDTQARYAEALKSAKTVFWNGPMGVFEWKKYSGGTMAVMNAVADSGAFSVVNGEVGFGSTVTVRGDDRWSFGASLGYSNGQAAGKVQFRFAN